MTPTTAELQTVRTITKEEPVYVALHLVERLALKTENIHVLKLALQVESQGRNNHALTRLLRYSITTLEAKQLKQQSNQSTK